MIVSRFRTLGWVGAIALSALGCYLVTQQVASEKARLDHVHRDIVTAERDIRRLGTEIETRGRLPQVERWNAEFALAAPRANQFVDGPVQLASLTAPKGAPVLPLNPQAAPPASVREASFTPPPPAAPKARPVFAAASPAAAAPEQPLLRHATFEKPAPRLDVKPTRIALESDGFAEDLERLAAREAKKSRQ